MEFALFIGTYLMAVTFYFDSFFMNDTEDLD